MNGDIRTFTFAGGRVVRERVMSVDQQPRRITYSVLYDPFTRSCQEYRGRQSPG
jgi:hypothetical protein